MKGRPRVILIALKLYNALIGPRTWSWYIPIITSNFLISFFKKIVSAGKGPWIGILFLFKELIAGIIILFSSLTFTGLSQWGFRPVIAILAFFPNFLL